MWICFSGGKTCFYGGKDWQREKESWQLRICGSCQTPSETVKKNKKTTTECISFPTLDAHGLVHTHKWGTGVSVGDCSGGTSTRRYKIVQNTHLACCSIPPEIKIFIYLEEATMWGSFEKEKTTFPADVSPTTRMKSSRISAGMSFRCMSPLNIRPSLKSPLILIELMNAWVSLVDKFQP